MQSQRISTPIPSISRHTLPLQRVLGQDVGDRGTKLSGAGRAGVGKLWGRLQSYRHSEWANSRNQAGEIPVASLVMSIADPATDRFGIHR